MALPLKQIHILISILVFAVLACSVVSPTAPTPTSTLPPVVYHRNSSTDEPAAPQILTENDETNLPPATVPAPLISLQSAVAPSTWRPHCSG
jgi:hypothetical protein